jgi:hypothetical protein
MGRRYRLDVVPTRIRSDEDKDLTCFLPRDIAVNIAALPCRRSMCAKRRRRLISYSDDANSRPI